MHIISTFDHSTHLELALTRLEQIGISKENLLVVPLEVFNEKNLMMDSIHYSDGISLLDAGLVCATALTVVGSSYGFVLHWGPIIWGLIGAVTGFFIGFILDLLIFKKRRIQKKNKIQLGITVFVLIHCDPLIVDKVKNILQQNHSMNYGIINLNS